MRGFILASLVFLFTGWDISPHKPAGETGNPTTSEKDSVCTIKSLKIKLLDSIIQVHHKLYNFNGAVLIAEEGEVLYENALGYVDFSNKTPLDPYALFQLASVSKQFTAMAALILHEQGKLSLDDDVKKYIAGFPYTGITVKHLLQHTSGLPDYVNEYYFDRYFPDTVIRNYHLVDIMRKYKLRLKFKPGLRHDYNNTGYAMLALVVEAASGMPFEDFMQQSIFKPLGMNNTYLYTCLAHCEDNVCVVSPYKLKPSKTAKLNNVTGDKGIYSCVRDLYLWDQALYTEKLVSKATLEQAFSPGKTAYGKEFQYGYGFRIDTTAEGNRLIYHRGLWQSYCPALMRYVDDKKTIIVLDNMIPPFSTTRLLNDLSSVVLKDYTTPEPAPVAASDSTAVMPDGSGGVE